VELLDDPGERVELAGAALRKDPVLLGDEARSSSLFGGARHIYVRATGDEAHDAVANLVQGTGDACPVLIVATSATDKSRTAKLLEKRDDALVAMFWPPDLPSVTASVRTMADAAGLRLNGDIAERIARAAGLDVRLARSEVEKLALYLDASPAAPRNADAEALEAIGATTEEDGFAALVNAVLGGEVRKIPAEIQRMRTLSLNPVGVLLAIERRAAQLARLAATLGGRRLGDLDRGAKARLGIFWKEERDIAAQLQRWRGRDLDRLVAKVVALHRALLANSQSAELLLAQGLAEIARHAARR
jgi:DNA polymerase-3 subunit delta